LAIGTQKLKFILAFGILVFWVFGILDLWYFGIFGFWVLGFDIVLDFGFGILDFGFLFITFLPKIS